MGFYHQSSIFYLAIWEGTVGRFSFHGCEPNDVVSGWTAEINQQSPGWERLCVVLNGDGELNPFDRWRDSNLIQKKKIYISFSCYYRMVIFVSERQVSKSHVCLLESWDGKLRKTIGPFSYKTKPNDRPN